MAEPFPEPQDGEARVDPAQDLMRRWRFRNHAIARRADRRVDVVAVTSDRQEDLLTGMQPHGDEDIWAFREDQDWG